MKGLSAEARRGQIKAGEFSRPPTLDGSERLAIRCRHHWSRQHEKRLCGRSCRNDSQWRDNYVGTSERQTAQVAAKRDLPRWGAPGKSVGKLFDAALVSTLTASHIGLNPKAQQQMLAKQIVIDLVPQGTLVERIRAGGCRLGGVLKAITPSPVPGPMIPIGPAASRVLGPTGNASASGAIAVAAKSLTIFSEPSPRLRCRSWVENDQPRSVSATLSRDIGPATGRAPPNPDRNAGGRTSRSDRASSLNPIRASIKQLA
jgi:hypothetical protein